MIRFDGKLGARCAATVLAAFVLMGGTALAQDDVGSIVAVEGAAERSRGGQWQAAASGDALVLKDELRTGADGKMQAILRDDSVIDVGPDTHMVIDEAVVGGNKGSVFEVLKGQIRNVVSDYYDDPLAYYDVETPNAVSGVRGTNFMVGYNEKTRTSDVACFGGKVRVRNKRDTEGRNAVMCADGQRTTIVGDLDPTPPVDMPEREIQRYLEQFEISSFPDGGAAGGDPIFDADDVPDSERAVTGGSPSSSRDAPPVFRNEDRATPGGIIDQPPGPVQGEGDVIIEF